MGAPSGYNDNGAVYGSQKVTLVPPTGAAAGASTGPFVAKNIKADIYDADRGVSKDELGNETKQWFMGKIPLGTATLQFPNNTTPAPVQYSVMPLVPIGGNAQTPVNFIIYKLGVTYDQSGETMMDVSIAQAQGGAVAPPVA